ncbi:phosphotransferase family protein [Terrabacter sp. BE26]|uniref:phosphotransferase family protein n=1 Tax=Terrabacter sp. BE26 TaxID=2898152 RepID=UPI0035BE8414
MLDATDLHGLPAARESSPIFLTRWRELEAPLHLLDPWWAAHHDELTGHAERAALIDGQALLHWDIRADNVMLTGDRVVVIDWARTRRGAPWMDHALLALDCSMSGSELATAQLADTDPVLRTRDPGDLLALAAAAAMSFAARTTEPAPQGLPTCQPRARAGPTPYGPTWQARSRPAHPAGESGDSHGPDRGRWNRATTARWSGPVSTATVTSWPAAAANWRGRGRGGARHT